MDWLILVVLPNWIRAVPPSGPTPPVGPQGQGFMIEGRKPQNTTTVRDATLFLKTFLPFGGVNWHGNTINNFQHNSYHRRGVAYGNAGVQQRYGGNNAVRGGAQGRTDFRGRDNAGNRTRRSGRNCRKFAAACRAATPATAAARRVATPQIAPAALTPQAKRKARPMPQAAGPPHGNAGGQPAGGSNTSDNVQSSGAANAQSQRGRSSVGGGGGGGARAGGGGRRRACGRWRRPWRRRRRRTALRDPAQARHRAARAIGPGTRRILPLRL